MMQAQELRGKDQQALEALLRDLYREQFNLRMQKGSGQTPNPSQHKKVRRDIARIKTVINEKGAA